LRRLEIDIGPPATAGFLTSQGPAGIVFSDATRYNFNMTLTLSSELQQALDEGGGRPLRVEDPRTRKAYVLVEWNVARTWIEAPDEVDGNWSEKKTLVGAN